MVSEGGFSLLELRKLTLDEFYSFYFRLQDVFVDKGLIDEEEANTIPNEENTVNQLRQQLSKIK